MHERPKAARAEYGDYSLMVKPQFVELKSRVRFSLVAQV